MFEYSILILVSMAGVAMLSGLVKGVVGFGMPMIIVSGLASFLPIETALAALIIPTLVGNVWQALRNGWRAAYDSIRRYRLYLAVMLVFLVFSAQLIRVLSQDILFLIIGVPIVFFALVQLLGWELKISKGRRNLAEVLLGSVAGFVGGLSGVWGPPLVVYLTATNTPKLEQMRVQGAVYALGAVMLAAAHVQSGILNATSVQLSVALVVPVVIGMRLGQWVHDRMPQHKFRSITLVVLILVGLNLIRRGLIG